MEFVATVGTKTGFSEVTCEVLMQDRQSTNPNERTNELQSHELFHNIDVVLVQIERIGQFSLIVSTQS